MKAHNIAITCILALLLSAATVSADTIPGGDVSGTWYAANSPYYIAGNITIPADSTLTIEPAVEVNFLGTYGLTVNGLLEAVGTETDSVRFAPTTNWSGITFSNAPDSSHLVYCTISGVDDIRYSIRCINYSNPIISHCRISRADDNYRNISIEGSNPSISDCVITHGTNGIFWDNYASTPIAVSGCTISSCTESAVVKYSGNLTMTDCTITDNACYNNSGAGIRSVYENLTLINCTISNNVSYGAGGGIYCIGGSHAFINCAIKGNISLCMHDPYIGGGGVCLNNASGNIFHCAIYNNFSHPGGGGITISGAGSLTLDHCTIDGNNTEAQFSPGSGMWLGGGSTTGVANSIISYNSGGYGIHNQGTITAGYNDFYGNESGAIAGNVPSGFGVLDTVNYNGDSCDVYFNIFMDPIYADTANNDFHLTAGSPCIDAGDPASPLDPDSTITDMGRYFFDQSAPSIALSATALDFGSVTVGLSAGLPLVIYNIGNANLLISDILNGLAVFTHNWDPQDSVILPHDSLGVTVTFTPDDTLTFADTLWIENNDTLGCVTLAGQGLSTGVAEGLATIPKEFALRQPLPNPCRSFVRLQFELPKASMVDLSVYDVGGRMISRLVNGLCEAGIHDVTLDASRLSAGVYFYRLKASGYTAIRKVIVTK